MPRFTGTLHKSADGTAGTGRSFTNYPVRIVRTLDSNKYPYPILLGDNYSDQLGWVNQSDLTY